MEVKQIARDHSLETKLLKTFLLQLHLKIKREKFQKLLLNLIIDHP